MSSKYAEAGVDVKKRGIEIFQKTLSNLFPGAFCVVIQDPHLPKYGLVTHADSTGTKPIAAYLYWKETGDAQWFRGLAQDVLAMNINDIVCVGAKPINFVDYIAINPNKVSKTNLLKALNEGFKKSIETLRKLGLEILFSGGETADLPDVIRTIDVSGVVNGRVELSKIITGDEIKPGDVIIGLRSGGKTMYEDKENSGIMCNGLTLARHCLLRKEYRQKYPEISEPEGKGYQGRFKIDTYVDDLQMTVGEALVSPMRFYSPVILEMLEKHVEDITGLVHNMGGGMTKCLRIGTNINFIKDNIIEPDPIFHLIQRESGENWRSMFEIFNMGTGFEIIAKPNATNNLLEISEKHRLQAQVIGKCEKSIGQNRVSIICRWGKFQYQREC